MPLFNDRSHLRRWLIWSIFALPLGGGIAFDSGRRLYAIDAPWASDDPHWFGLFAGLLFVVVGCVAICTHLFARPLTPKEERMRDMMRDWQRERSRFPGGGDS